MTLQCIYMQDSVWNNGRIRYLDVPTTSSTTALAKKSDSKSTSDFTVRISLFIDRMTDLHSEEELLRQLLVKSMRIREKGLLTYLGSLSTHLASPLNYL